MNGPVFGNQSTRGKIKIVSVTADIVLNPLFQISDTADAIGVEELGLRVAKTLLTPPAHHPRPTSGILVAITVIVSTLALSGRWAM